MTSLEETGSVKDDIETSFDYKDDSRRFQEIQRHYRLKMRKYLKEIIGLIFIVFLVFTFRSVFFEPFKIPSGSMIPTLHIGDFILVKKFAYGWKVPFSDITIGHSSFDPIYLFGRSQVKRGDIIVFKFPKNKNINYIKRVIGLPGDTVEVKDKIIYINGKKIKTIKLDKDKYMQNMDEKFKDENLSFYRAYLGKKSFVYQVSNDNYFLVNNEKVTVPENQYFVMGDNRDYSYDSRLWGFVPFESIKGKAVLVWMSLEVPENESKDIVLRSSRIGTLIE